MKLRVISEVVSMSGDQFFGHMGKIYKAATGEVPDRQSRYDRQRRYEQTEAKYTPKSPDPNKVCQNCANFKKDGSCKFVEGQISPSGVCRFFKINPKVGS